MRVFSVIGIFVGIVIMGSLITAPVIAHEVHLSAVPIH